MVEAAIDEPRWLRVELYNTAGLMTDLFRVAYHETDALIFVFWPSRIRESTWGLGRQVSN